MRRVLIVLVVLALVPSWGASAAPVVDASDIERVFHDSYGNPTASGTTPFFAAGTDLAFDRHFIYAAEQAGSGDTAGGVHIYKADKKGGTKKVGFVNCPGSQNDVAVVEPGIIALAYHSETGTTCSEQTGTAKTAGVRLFDVSDPANPVALGASPSLPGGTHTLTVHPSGDYIYASPGGLPTNGGVGGAQQILDISNRQGPFPVTTFQHNPSGCHDFTFFTSTAGDPLGICVGLTESTIWDTSNPTKPTILSHIVNPLIQFHHSAAITDDGKTLVIGDEAIGANECLGGPTGAMYAYDISNPSLPIPKGYFGINRSHQNAPVNSSTAGLPGSGRDTWCTAHLYNFIPGTSLMVGVWYSGGLNVIDWSNPAAPRELAHYRTTGASYAAGDVTNYWSGYWHNGRIYANDRVRGLDVLKWTAYTDQFGGKNPKAAEVAAWSQSLSATSTGWHAGQFSKVPTASQAAVISQRGAADLRTDLPTWACRMSLLQ